MLFVATVFISEAVGEIATLTDIFRKMDFENTLGKRRIFVIKLRKC